MPRYTPEQHKQIAQRLHEKIKSDVSERSGYNPRQGFDATKLAAWRKMYRQHPQHPQLLRHLDAARQSMTPRSYPLPANTINMPPNNPQSITAAIKPADIVQQSTNLVAYAKLHADASHQHLQRCQELRQQLRRLPKSHPELAAARRSYVMHNKLAAVHQRVHQQLINGHRRLTGQRLHSSSAMLAALQTELSDGNPDAGRVPEDDFGAALDQHLAAQNFHQTDYNPGVPGFRWRHWHSGGSKVNWPELSTHLQNHGFTQHGYDDLNYWQRGRNSVIGHVSSPVVVHGYKDTE